MTTNCLAAAEILARDGIDATVLHFHTIKPLDGAAVLEFAHGAELVVTVEEGTRIGGFGSAVADHLLEHGAVPALMRLGLPDAFPDKYGVQDDLFEVYGLKPEQIATTIAAAAKKAKVA